MFNCFQQPHVVSLGVVCAFLPRFALTQRQLYVSERQKCTETGSAWPHWRLERRNALTRDRESRLISPPLFFVFFWWGVFLPCLACSSLVVRNLSGGVCGKMHTPKHIHAHGLFKSGQPLWAMHVGVTVIQCWIVGGYCSVQGLRWLSYSGVCVCVGMYRVWVTHEYSDSGAEVGQICCQQLVKTSQ